MSRRDQWQQVRDSMLGQATTAKTVAERETIPEKACGLCKQFRENAYASDGRGFCSVLKIGSNIAADTPIYVTEGEVGFVTFFNTDAAGCTHFVKMDLIDTDGTECADPEFRRMQRQMEKITR